MKKIKEIFLKHIPVLTEENEQDLTTRFYIHLVSILLCIFAILFAKHLLLPIIIGIILLIMTPFCFMPFITAKKYPNFIWFFKNKTLIERLSSMSIMVTLFIIAMLCIMTNLANKGIISYGLFNKFALVYLSVFLLVGILILIIFIVSIFKWLSRIFKSKRGNK